MLPRRPVALLAMARDLPAVLLPGDLCDRLTRVADVDLDLVVGDFGEPRARDALRTAEILLTGWGCPSVDEQVLAAAPRLRAIVHAAGTVRGIVSDAAWQRGIAVSSAAAANAVPVAEYTVAMIVLVNKGIVPRMARTGTAVLAGALWAPSHRDLGNLGRVVGIVGASRVGRRVIELLAGYDLEVVLADPTLSADEADALGVRLTELDELVRVSHVVSIHAPDIPQTRHLFDARRLALLRDGAMLINTARGGLVDTAALEAELATGRINAILDVTDPEPLPPASPLLELPNVLVTPHVAGSMGREIARLGAAAVAEVERYARGEDFAHPVDSDTRAIVA